MPTLNVTFDISLHRGQAEVRDSPARFKVLACGRRWGKTMLASLLTVARAADGQAVWYVAPDFPRSSRGWREIKEIALQIPGTVIREAERRIEFVSGGWLEVKSSHNENALRGEGLDFVVLDEASFFARESTWDAEIRPALADKQGDALLISTFNGENYFYDLYERGQSDVYPEWQSWRYPTITNPYIDPREIEEAKATTPRAEYEQEYEANPLVYVGAVFAGEDIQRAVERGAADSWNLASISASSEVFAGLDWGYTNATAFELCREHPSDGRISWFYEKLWVATQLEKRVGAIVEACREYNVQVIYADAAGADQNAMLTAHLEDAELPTEVVAVAFNKYKDNAIVTRRWYLEQGLEDMSPDCPELIRTTKRYRYKEETQKEEVVKEDDHPVDAATAFYASRRTSLVESR